MRYQGPTYFECECGAEVDLDDDWRPGDRMACDLCGYEQVLQPLSAWRTPTTPLRGELTRLGETSA